MNFLAFLSETHGSQIESALTESLGLSHEEAISILPKIAPLVLGGLGRQAKKHGPEKIEEILEEHGQTPPEDFQALMEERAESGDPMKSLSSLVGSGGGTLSNILSGGGPMGGLLSGKIRSIANSALGDLLEVDAEKAGKVLPMLIPVLLSSLNQFKKDSDSGIDSILTILETEGDESALESMINGVLSGSGLGGFFGKK